MIGTCSLVAVALHAGGPAIAHRTAAAGGGGITLAVLAVLGGAAVSLGAFLIRRVVRARRRFGDQLKLVEDEVASAVSDPLLIHQARRRLRLP